MDDQIQNEIQIYNQGLMRENITQKETLIFIWFALGKFQ